MRSVWPERYPFGKTFAVSMVDDTDQATLAAIRPVYECLLQHGITITKTVWPLPPVEPSGDQRSIPDAIRYTATLDEDAYVDFCRMLQKSGCEIAMHTASGGNNIRGRTLQAYSVFEDAFQHSPFTNVMHGRNFDNIYWGKLLVEQGILSRAIQWFEPQDFFGHEPHSKYYWGDVCKDRTRYVRSFETLHPDTLHFDPATPYHDPTKPHVNWWFSSSNGVGARLYQLLAPVKIRQLHCDRGASIIHFYSRAVSDHNHSSQVDPRFSALCAYLGSVAYGWYVPVVTLLDRLRAIRQLTVTVRSETILVENRSGMSISDFALNTPGGVMVWDEYGTELSKRRNDYGQIPLGNLGSTCLLRYSSIEPIRSVSPTTVTPNYWRLASGTANRLASDYWHGRRGRVNSDTYQFPTL